MLLSIAPLGASVEAMAQLTDIDTVDFQLRFSLQGSLLTDNVEWFLFMPAAEIALVRESGA